LRLGVVVSSRSLRRVWMRIHRRNAATTASAVMWNVLRRLFAPISTRKKAAQKRAGLQVR
jgi:hypothetical protein